MNELVTQARAGSEAAFRSLYDLTAGRIHALCLRLAADSALAEELTQDVFVRAWEKLDTFRGESAFTTWLHRLAINVVLQERRARGRREDRVFAVGDLDEIAPAAAGSSPGIRMDLERAIAALPPGARTVFVLHDIEGYQHDEIAEITGTAAGTSKAQLFRARKLLRGLLDR